MTNFESRSEKAKDDQPLQIMVVDDTAIYRKIISEILAEIPNVEVVASAYNGLDALNKILIYQPDLLTLDLEMPEMGGLEVLEQLQEKSLDVGALIVSTHTTEGSIMTIKALELGAFDVVLKPELHSADESRELIKDRLIFMVEAYRKFLKNKQRTQKSVLTEFSTRQAVIQNSFPSDVIPPRQSEVVAIGVSTGGPIALAEVLSRFPKDFDVPILVAQHMPSGFTASLAHSLNKKCALEVKEASHKDLLRPGCVYIAPGGHHMKIESNFLGIKYICITDEETGTNCKPSVDLLFRSVAEQFGAHAVGVIMTGMGSDGLQGMKKMKRNGATLIAQDEASCVVYGMPATVVAAGISDMVVSLSEIAVAISHSIQSSRKGL